MSRLTKTPQNPIPSEFSGNGVPLRARSCLFRIALVASFAGLLLSCAGFPERSWLKETKGFRDRAMRKPRVETIVKRFREVRVKDRDLAVEAVAGDTSVTGQEGLLELMAKPEVQSDPGLKAKVLDEIKKRPEPDTPKKMLDKMVANPDLIDAGTVNYISDTLGAAAAPQLAEVVKKEPQRLSPELIAYFTKSEYQPAHPMILNGIQKKPDLVDGPLAAYFIKHKESDAPAAFLAALRKKPELTALEPLSQLFLEYKYPEAAPVLLGHVESQPEFASGPLIRYFGKVRYQKAVPFIKKELNEYKFIQEGVAALAAMNTEELNLYLLALGRDKNPQLRLAALEQVAVMSSPKIRRRAYPDMLAILKNHSTEPREVVWASTEFFRRSRYEPRGFEMLRTVYKRNKDTQTKERALKAMAAMRGMTLRQMRLALARGIRGADAHLALDRYKQGKRRRAKPVRRKARLPKSSACRMKRSYPPSYPKRLRKMFDQRFGPALGQGLRTRLNNALKSYANGNTATSALVRRAYTRYLGLSEKTVAQAVRRGLSYPGSLSAIVWRVHTEYGSERMRFYALASIFGIERWKAQEIMELVRKQCL